MGRVLLGRSGRRRSLEGEVVDLGVVEAARAWPRPGPDRRQPGAPGERAVGLGLALVEARTVSAVISSEIRFWPSLASYSRVRKRPSTKTRLPLRRFSAARSPRSPQTLTRNQSVDSIHSPVCWFFVDWLTATVKLATGRPLGV